MARPRPRTKRSPGGKRQAIGDRPLSKRQRTAFANRLSGLVPSEPLADQRAAAAQLVKNAPLAPPEQIKPTRPQGLTARTHGAMVRLAPATADAQSKVRGAPGRAVAPKTPPKNIPHA